MSLVDALLCGLLVVQSGLMTWGAWLLYGRATQAARYDLDATAQALKMQALIDARVAARVVQVEVDATTGAIRSIAKTAARAGEQPPDPNVRTSSIIDEVHEAEREANRVTGEADYVKRDPFNQPLPPMEA